ncbi:MAG: hypothetical protein EXS08_13760 [Planctomycetes bacterium]|nr:hypothetical protein [Planctomycetota bacterium]
MDASVLIGGAYLVLKAAAYCTWCWVGVRVFRPERAAKLGLGVGLGVLRMLLGLVFGVGIFLAGGAVMESLAGVEALPFGVASALTYLAVYVPVRWLEWGLIEFLLVTGERDFTTVLGGSGKRGVRWRLGGIALSCLADVPWMLAAGGIPFGRFMC